MIARKSPGHARTLKAFGGSGTLELVALIANCASIAITPRVFDQQLREER